MTDPTRTRHFSPTPAWLIYGLLVIEGLLWLSDRFQWPTWHKGYAVLISVAAVGVVFVVMFLWLIVALVFHLRFQFSIRSLLILTVAVAIPFNWMAVEMKAAREQAETVDMVLKLGGFIDYTWQFDANGTRTYKAQPPGPEWLRKLLGTDFFSSVIRVGFFSDEVMADMRMLHVSTQLTDAGLARIAGLTQLQGLSLNSTQITDAGLAQIAGLPQLQALYLYNAQITDAGLLHIARLNRLRWLYLGTSQITDAGLKHLAGLNQLQALYFTSTNITDEGVAKLQPALPNCKIVRVPNNP